MLDPETYYPGNRDELLTRLVFVVAQLSNLHLLLHDAKQLERRARDKVTHEAPVDESVASIKRRADLDSYEHWARVGDLEAQIASYTEERDLIRFLVTEIHHAG